MVSPGHDSAVSSSIRKSIVDLILFTSGILVRLGHNTGTGPKINFLSSLSQTFCSLKKFHVKHQFINVLLVNSGNTKQDGM